MGTDTPDAWARGKRDKAARYVRELGPLIARASAALTPGVHVAAHCGFAINGSRKSNTTGWRSCSADERAEALREGRTGVKFRRQQVIGTRCPIPMVVAAS